MTLHDYLIKSLPQTVMISLQVGDDVLQYNYWNWFHQKSQLHLLKDDFSIGHILHGGSVVSNDDGSVTFSSQYHPTKCLLNFYLGKAIN